MEASNKLQALSESALQDLLNNITSMKSFVIEQAPDVCQQIISWTVVKGGMGIIGIGILISVWLWVFRKCKKSESDPHNSFDSTDCNIIVVIMSAAFFILGFGFLVDVYYAIEALIAPKLFLLEYITKMIN